MKAIINLFFLFILTLNSVKAQDSLLIYKSGKIIGRYSLADFDTLLFQNPGIIQDIDGNRYDKIKIGSQVWMKQNLKATHYNDGQEIPLVTNNLNWSNLTTPGFCWYKNDQTTYGQTYGALYNWYTVNTGKLCPQGWHVPTATDWSTLTETILGGYLKAGGYLKEKGTEHWAAPNMNAIDSVQFSGRPAGQRIPGGSYINIGQIGGFWSSKENNVNDALYIELSYDLQSARYLNTDKKNGLSVRCIMDK